MTPIQKVTAHIYMCPTGCGCLWKDNRDETMSLFGPNSKSCDVCESLSLNELVPLYATPQPPAVPDSQKLISNLRESLEIQERKIERLRELLQKASDYKDYLQSPEESPVWIWQGDGEDYPDSMANSLTVVIRADQLRALIHAVPDGYVLVPVVNCPNAGCNDSGCIPIQVGEDDLEPQQCEFCYTTPNSVFNLAPVLAAAQQGGGK